MKSSVRLKGRAALLLPNFLVMAAAAMRQPPYGAEVGASAVQPEKRLTAPAGGEGVASAMNWPSL